MAFLYLLTADLRLRTIAEKLNVNSSHLSSRLHKEYGGTLAEFVNSQRAEYGILLLQNTTKPVQAVAVKSGIQDVTCFIRLFKKQTGITPGQCRARQGKAPPDRT